jgi:hypothetical protein
MITITYCFWVVSWIGASVLIAYVWKKKLNREYPIFFAFLVVETVFDVTNCSLSFLSSKVFYYYSFWTSMAVTTCLGFFVLQEIFRHIFRPYESLRTFASTLFRWSTLVLLMVAAIMALTSAPITRSPITNYIYTIDRSVQLMQCGLVLFMFLFARQLGLTQAHRVFGITIGLGLRASSHLIAVMLRSKFPELVLRDSLNIMIMVIYLAVVALWFTYMYRPEPERRRGSLLDQSESWNYALAAATSSDGGAAFLPNVVDTVERVLNKRSISISSEFKLRG